MSESIPPFKPFEKPPSFIVPVEARIPAIKARTETYGNTANTETGAAFPDQFISYLAQSIQPWIFNEGAMRDEIAKEREDWDYILEHDGPEAREEALKAISELPTDIENRYPLTTIFKHFKGQVVIDLGAGESYYIHNLCSVIGAKAYIGVEKFFC